VDYFTICIATVSITCNVYVIRLNMAQFPDSKDYKSKPRGMSEFAMHAI